MRAASSRFNPSRSFTNNARSAVGRVGLGDQVEEVERAASGGACQVSHDGRHDAARRPGDDDDRVGAEGAGRVGLLAGALFQPDGQTDRAAPADLDDTGVPERLVHQCAGDLARLGAGLDVEHLHECGAALPGEGLREAAHRPGHGTSCAGFVVAVRPTVAGGAHEERPRLTEALVHARGRRRRAT